MTLDDIPADVQMTLTPELRRLFVLAHCYPTCHACDLTIEVGKDFTLASLNGSDTMIGTCCTKEKLIEVRRKRAAAKARSGHGYSRPSLVMSDAGGQ